MKGRKTMAKTYTWTWGKYDGLFKDKMGDSFSETWKYETDGDEQYKEMERRAIELVKAGYLPEKIEEVK